MGGSPCLLLHDRLRPGSDLLLAGLDRRGHGGLGRSLRCLDRGSLRSHRSLRCLARGAVATGAAGAGADTAGAGAGAGATGAGAGATTSPRGSITMARD